MRTLSHSLCSKKWHGLPVRNLEILTLLGSHKGGTTQVLSLDTEYHVFHLDS